MAIDKSDKVHTDRYGNPIDRTVGYARGKILRSSVEERLRLVHGQRVATQRLAERGSKSIGIFTGNLRAFPMQAERMPVVCDEWTGPGLVDEAFQEAGVKHLGGSRPLHSAALFNRTSGGLIAAIGALCAGRPVVSAVPAGSKSHASVSRGCYAARVDLIECDTAAAFDDAVDAQKPALVLVTTVSSNLDRMPEATIAAMVRAAARAGAISLIDDAYGARIRPILHGGEHGLRLGADLVITNCDKAGMIGPRAGLLVGVDAHVQRVAAKAAEFGSEARAPIVAAVTESLEMFAPAWLQEESDMGKELTGLFEQKFGAERVQRSDLGPIIVEDELFAMALERAGITPAGTGLVPAEATSALGVILLRDHGVLTTNTHGQPGAKVSLRLRPTPDGIGWLGSLSAVVDALDASLDTLAPLMGNTAAISRLIIGKEI
ncbi:aminotransferase class I/II-fold pyridoxal phosphate-dependent enzyme [Bordetella genomosp. 10]|uniref:aminotransferase class I/II-fold pyridoxal phosphate-dependent enzyme n=1 Tax=Bordetella genomosp. 10 TaxID=1416804 RepID=UPI00211B25E9|nr:aminotransferase class I/II-fold pyridoxal phosphate-dependent enzyme [Bordetella genomosp. 10]